MSDDSKTAPPCSLGVGDVDGGGAEEWSFKHGHPVVLKRMLCVGAGGRQFQERLAVVRVDQAADDEAGRDVVPAQLAVAVGALANRWVVHRRVRHRGAATTSAIRSGRSRPRPVAARPFRQRPTSLPGRRTLVCLPRAVHMGSKGICPTSNMPQSIAQARVGGGLFDWMLDVSSAVGMLACNPDALFSPQRRSPTQLSTAFASLMSQMPTLKTNRRHRSRVRVKFTLFGYEVQVYGQTVFAPPGRTKQKLAATCVARWANPSCRSIHRPKFVSQNAPHVQFSPPFLVGSL